MLELRKTDDYEIPSAESVVELHIFWSKRRARYLNQMGLEIRLVRPKSDLWQALNRTPRMNLSDYFKTADSSDRIDAKKDK